MAVAVQKLARRTVLATLKADAALTDAVPAARIYTQATPADPVWPFIKLGPPSTQRLKASCVNGGTVSLDIHAFGRGSPEETAEDHAGRIGGLIEAALSDRRLMLDTDEVIRVTLSDMQLLQDGSPDAFHYACQVNCRVLAA